MLVRSKLGHYEAELTDTPEGVKIVLWLRFQDGNMRKHLSTETVDVPFHFACSKVHDELWNAMPEVTILGDNKRK